MMLKRGSWKEQRLLYTISILLRENLRNEERKKVAVECITEVIREFELKWFGHLIIRKNEKPIT